MITDEVVSIIPKSFDEKVTALFLERRREATTASITEMILIATATCGQDRVLDLLSRQNGLLSISDEYRRVAKFYDAAKAGHAQCIEQLIHKGTKPNRRISEGKRLYGSQQGGDMTQSSNCKYLERLILMGLQLERFLYLTQRSTSFRRPEHLSETTPIYSRFF